MSSDNNFSKHPLQGDIPYKPVGFTPTVWRVGFRVPLLIVGSIVGAVAAAILHHSFDAYLSGNKVARF
jgi:hypothetical protein